MSEIDKILEALKRSFLYQINCELTEKQSKTLLEHIDDLRFAVNENKQRWIPVSERLPELFTIVLVCDCDGGMETDWIWNNKDGISRFMNSFKTVTHWMPLPEPPEVQE